MENNNFLLNSHPARQVSSSEMNNNNHNKGGNSNTINLNSSNNNNINNNNSSSSSSNGSKNIFLTLGRSHSSSIINNTTSAINKNLTSLLSGSNNHSTPSLQSLSQTSKQQSNSTVTANSNYHQLNSNDPNTLATNKLNGANIMKRNRSNTAGPSMMPSTSASAPLLPTTSFSRKKDTTIIKQPLNVANIFKRTDVIGRGKFGVVYKGYHIKTNHIYAIKVLNLDSNEDEIEDVQKEVKFLSSSKNIPNVTKYYGSYMNDTKLWIIMEYCAGGSLRTLLRAGPLDDKTMSVIFRELLFALSAIHHDKVIHRDIKAANVLISHDGKVKLCDFGVAAKLTQTRARRQSLAGTPFWMAPEVITESASYDSKADIWSLGITAYESATCNPPYCEVDAMRAMQMIVKNKPPRLEGKQYSQSLKEFVALCLDENPYERPNADTLLKSNFIVQYSSVKVSHLKELIIRYHNYKIKNKNNMSTVDNEPSSLNKEEHQKVKTSKMKTAKTTTSGKSIKEIKSNKRTNEQIISSSNAVNIPSTPMPLAPSMGDKTFSDVFGAAVSANKNKLKQQESVNGSLKQTSNESSKESVITNSRIITLTQDENKDKQKKEDEGEEEEKEEEEEGVDAEEEEEEIIEWDFESINPSETTNDKIKKTSIQNQMKTNYKSDINDENYWDEERNEYPYINDDEKQNTSTNHMNVTMGRQFSYFNTQSAAAAAASMINSYHPHQGNTINRSYKVVQNTIHTGNLKYSNTYKNTLNYNIYSNNNVQGTIQTNKNMSLKTDGNNNNRFSNTRVKSSNNKHDQMESSYSNKVINDAPQPPRNLMKLFEDLDTRNPSELELPLMTPTPLIDHFGNEPKSYFDNIPNAQRNENYGMYMMKNKKYLQEGKTNSNLSLNIESTGTPLSENNVVEIEIPDELPVVTTPSMASIPAQINSRSRSSTLNAVLTKNANAVANNMELHRRGTVSTGYLKNPTITNSQNNTINGEHTNNSNEVSPNEPETFKIANNNGSGTSPVKLDLRVNTTNNTTSYNPKELLEEGMGRKSPTASSAKQARTSSPNQRSMFSSEPLSAMTPSSSFIPSPKRKRNLSIVGGQPKAVLGDTKSNTDIMNSLLQPFNAVNSNEPVNDETIKPGFGESGINTNKRLTRDFKRNNPNLKLEMPLPNNNIKSAAAQSIELISRGITKNGQNDEVITEQPLPTSSINQFGFNTNTTSNIAIAMTPLAEKNMMFCTSDIKKSEENNLSGILEENVVSNEMGKTNTQGLPSGLGTINDSINNKSSVNLERKISDVNGTANNISSINKPEINSTTKNDGVNVFDSKNNTSQLTINNNSNQSGLVNGLTNSTTNVSNTSSNNINMIKKPSSPLNSLDDRKTTTTEQPSSTNNEAPLTNTSPSAMLNNFLAQNAASSVSLETTGTINNNSISQDTSIENNSGSQLSTTTSIINPRINSRIRTSSITNNTSTVTIPKIDDFADMRIVLLDYPALKENETGITKVNGNEHSDSSPLEYAFEEEKDTVNNIDNKDSTNNSSTIDDKNDVKITDLKEFLEEERDHYYYYALEQEQRDMLMSDLKNLIMDYEKSFASLEQEFKIFDDSLE
ncbi:Pkinase-domain-containing protein [Hanseniaspora valbyensis NRRL Y-1626]|uniref:non-specific serine/threonine protein kinase n=1 Tax=Hanseniaspora valbyensis NRRL Y-1626 TaxID=766949 RepID=A0A1B7TD33_9ASCO|nr:Pkinase-domain-containing protein [Hanseniaspora valbyensis NRRL Y-1626]